MIEDLLEVSAVVDQILVAGTIAEIQTILNVEDGAAADQTDEEIRDAYHNMVPRATNQELIDLTEGNPRHYTPSDLAIAINNSLAAGVVTIATEQVITGKKTFRNDDGLVYEGDDGGGTAGRYTIKGILASAASDVDVTMNISDNAITINNAGGNPTIDYTLGSLLEVGIIKGRIGLPAQSGAGAPTVTEFPADTMGFWEDTDDSRFYLYANRGGTLKSVELT